MLFRLNATINRNCKYIFRFSKNEINNECFWLNELGLLTIKLKDLVYKMLA